MTSMQTMLSRSRFVENSRALLSARIKLNWKIVHSAVIAHEGEIKIRIKLRSGDIVVRYI